jgi:3-deoxy-D-manno-octulosonate 8-phosphate phosphatase (KDO 8-P phosphatase)
MTKEIRNPNDEGKARDISAGIGSFELSHSLDIRHSDFVII